MSASLHLATARKILDAALSEAGRMDVAMSVAVCDGGGHLVAFARMDGCMILAAETAQAKARTAVYFRRPTHETVERSRLHPTVYQSFVQAATAPLVMSMGGYPLWDGDTLVGAVAAAGGTGEEDMAVAQAGAGVWERRSEP